MPEAHSSDAARTISIGRVRKVRLVRNPATPLLSALAILNEAKKRRETAGPLLRQRIPERKPNLVRGLLSTASCQLLIFGFFNCPAYMHRAEILETVLEFVPVFRGRLDSEKRALPSMRSTHRLWPAGGSACPRTGPSQWPQSSKAGSLVIHSRSLGDLRTTV